MKEDLLALCENYEKGEIVTKVVIEEPYIPYIPPNWNRILILAESQNLSSSYEGYVEALRKLDSKDRRKRLGLNGLNSGNVGVGPWDDGSLKLAIEAAFGVSEKETAVSNAVLWSRRDSKGNNASPNADLKKLSSALWHEMLGIFKPKWVICSGNTAEEVIKKAGWEKKIKKLRLPSQQAMSRTSGMFQEDDLLRRYPEVKKLLDIHPEWVELHRKNKIFFACHAVSLHGGKKG